MIKIWIRRLALRWLRNIVDVADDRLHTAEVLLREDIANFSGASERGDTHRLAPGKVAAAAATHGAVSNPRNPRPPKPQETFLEWEARRSGVAPITKKSAQRSRRRKSAREFDLSLEGAR